MKESKIDIKENYIYRLDHKLLTILLRDRSSDKNIIWTTLVNTGKLKEQ